MANEYLDYFNMGKGIIRNSLTRVLVRKEGEGEFVGVGRNEYGEIVVEHNILKQIFYKEEEAIKVCELLENSGFDTKIVK